MPISTIRPIFITGVYRTGTTLLSRILDAHSQLAVTYDSVHFFRFCHGSFSPISDPANYRALLADVRERCEARWERKIDMEPVAEDLDSCNNVDYETVYDRMMTHLLLRGSKKEWGEKTLIAWSKIPDFLQMFPNGIAIQVVRDPRDVVASNRSLTYEPGLRYLDAAFACLSSMKAAIKYEAEFPPRSYHTVRYEDLVRKPDKVAKRLCEIIDVPYEPAVIDSGNLRDYKGNPWVKNTSYKGISNAVSDESVGKYRMQLSTVEKFFVEIIDRGVMERFDYAFDSQPLRGGEWERLHEILSDSFIAARFERWLLTNDGVEAYPSPPPRVLRDKPVE